MIWFTSDTHYFHKSMVKESWHGEKGMRAHLFSTVEQMNEFLILNYNTFVTPDDTVYHLGDFAFAKDAKTQEILSRLNGHIHLVRGNHDTDMNVKTRSMFESVQDYLEIKVGPEYVKLMSNEKYKRIVLCHYPFQVWRDSHWGSWHLHGHCHGSRK